ARDADPDGAADALRALARRLKKQDRIRESLVLWRRLCASDRATSEDRNELATLARRESITPPPPTAKRVSARAAKESRAATGASAAEGRKDRPERRKAAR
ncbi:MAG TPA: hypothetical protein VNO21_20915, partial [Polyangiaceae bacterium]|nr:hypothetical protein [Polyangiaceae bacterium]